MEVFRKIKVVPLAFESLGVRSMCTYVETPDIRILLDAGISLGPRRYGFPPHPKECEALKEGRERILEMAEKADVVTISHYHFDHHTPSYTDWAYNWSSAAIADQIYSGKLLFVKSYRSHINFSQRRRGWMFVKTSGKNAERLQAGDGRSFRFGSTILSFSNPVFHGEHDSFLGWVVMATVEHDKAERFLFTSDVQGPMCNETLDIILAQKPNLIIIGGPPIYLAETVRQENTEMAFENLEKIAKNVRVMILDHHLLRDEQWKTRAQTVFDSAFKNGNKVLTAAESIGEKNRFLEAQRDKLFDEDPPSQEFIKWTKIPVLKRKVTPPPI